MAYLLRPCWAVCERARFLQAYRLTVGAPLAAAAGVPQRPVRLPIPRRAQRPAWPVHTAAAVQLRQRRVLRLLLSARPGLSSPERHATQRALPWPQSHRIHYVPSSGASSVRLGRHAASNNRRLQGGCVATCTKDGFLRQGLFSLAMVVSCQEQCPHIYLPIPTRRAPALAARSVSKGAAAHMEEFFSH